MHIENGTGSPQSSARPSARGPAQSAIREFLSRQLTVAPRSRLERVFGRSPLDDRSAHWYWTAVGELEVVVALDRMGPDWRVFHGIPGPREDSGNEPAVIDHLVIGPAGVFTVSTYNHAGKDVWVGRRAFVVDEHPLPYIRVAETEVGHVERTLGEAMGSTVTACAIITLVEPGSLRLGHLPADVVVVASRAVSTWLASRLPVLEPAVVDRVAAVAADPATWGEIPAEAPAIGGDNECSLRQQFELVRGEVAAATVIRALWTVGVAVLLGTVLVAAGILQLLGTGVAGVSL